MTEFIITCPSELDADGHYRIDRWKELIRCKDCVECYFASNRIQSEQTFACGKHGIDVTPDFFCADGIAKDSIVLNK